MGTVRFLLAAIVVGFHCQFGVIHQTIGGLAAVEVFYIISGFYMAAAYERHYPGRPAAFFASRFARLYPFYLAVLVATFALHLWNPANESGIFNSLRTEERPYVINLSLLGLDLYSAMHSTTYLLVPQAWSISAEIVFYALLPALLLLNRKWLAGLVVAAFAIKMTILHVYEWKWAYFPFYSQIGYFGTGVVLFSLRDRLTWSTRAGYWLAALYCLYLLADVYADVDYHGASFRACRWLSQPASLFRRSSQGSTDRCRPRWAMPPMASISRIFSSSRSRSICRSLIRSR